MAKIPSINVKPKMIKVAVAVAIIAIVVLSVLFGCYYTINEQQQAVVTTFGIAHTEREAGLHLKIPFVQQVTLVDTTIQGLAIGYDELSNMSIEDESLMLTSDNNIVNVDFYVEYQVVDPEKALFATQNYKVVCKNLFQSKIRDQIGLHTVDDVITTGKLQIQEAIKQDITEMLTDLDIGIQLVNVTIQDSEPPTQEVMQAFMDVESAKQNAETAEYNAEQYKNEKIPAAEAKANKIVFDAEAAKQSRINEANGQVARFNSLYTEYRNYPLITKQRMFYETMQDVLPDLKVIINGSDGQLQTVYPLESFTGTSENNVTGGEGNE